MSMIRKLLFTYAGVAAVMLLSQQVFAASSSDEIKVRRLEMAFDTATVRVNQERMLYVEVFPRDADDKVLYWSTSDAEVAMVDHDGTVIGISPGTATITATSHNGKTATCLVTVPGAVLTEIDQNISNGTLEIAQASGGETLSAATLRLDVENAAKSVARGETAVLTYTDKNRVSTAALRSAAFSAEYQGRTASLQFRTLGQGGAIEGQLTIAPEYASSEDMELLVGVHTDDSRTAEIQAQATAWSGSPTAVVLLEQSGSYGQAVQVAARVDLTGMNTDSLQLYHYQNGTYTLLEQQAHWIDSGGYLQFSTSHGGYIIVVSAK